MAENTKVFKDNEVAANKVAASIMFSTFIIYTGVYIANLVGIFIIPYSVMNLAYILGSVCLLTPYIMVKKFHNYNWYMKYCFVFAAAMFIASTNAVLAFHMVAMFGIPILVSSIYFDNRLTNIAIVMTLIMTTISQLIYFNSDFVVDLNFFTPKKFVIFGIVPRSMGIIYFGWLSKKIAKRAYGILGDLMGAEEQNALMKKNSEIKNKAIDVTNILTVSVDELEKVTDNVSDSNKSIETEAGTVLNNTSNNVNNIIEINSNFKEIVENIVSLDNKTGDIAVLSNTVKELIQENEKLISMATNQMLDVNSSSDRCKNKIEGLGRQSKEIINIISLISDISDQTQLLSLNASIEAARAGEQGKGFMVVAEEINKLSNETKKALDNIGKVINDVVKETTEAVVAAEQSSEKTKAGLKNIRDARDASVEITNSNNVMTTNIDEIYRIAKIITKNSIDINKYLDAMKDSMNENYNMLENVSKTVESNSESTATLIHVVDTIKNVSGELSEIVNN